MNNLFNEDFIEFISALNDQNVKYLLVGGYSVVLHGYPRTTGDLDIWVKADKENYDKLVKAYLQFGLPLHDMTEDKFLNTDRYDVFTYGVPPVAIDIMTKCKGLVFDQAYNNSKNISVGDLKIRLIHLNDLLIAKKSSNRPKDMDDVQNLRK